MLNFEITSGEVYVSDPCYTKGLWCQKKLTDVKKGFWTVEAKKCNTGNWGTKVAELICRHKSCQILNEKIDEYIEADIGVDSGQAGIFDSSVFEPDNNEWYEKCCNITLSKEQFGLIKGGAVSSSGFGDGIYSLYVAKNKEKEIIAIKIVFINLDDELE